MDIFRALGKRIKVAFQIVVIDRIIRLLPIYYTSIKQLPIVNWFDLQENKFDALYKKRLFKRVPFFFHNIATEMYFEFEKVNMELIYEKRDIAIMASMAAREKNKAKEFNSRTMNNALLKKMAKQNKDNLTLNAMIDYIELTFESIGSLDVYKLTTSRAFSLYNQAIEKNKRLEKLYSKKS